MEEINQDIFLQIVHKLLIKEMLEDNKSRLIEFYILIPLFRQFLDDENALEVLRKKFRILPEVISFSDFYCQFIAKWVPIGNNIFSFTTILNIHMNNDDSEILRNRLFIYEDNNTTVDKDATLSKINEMRGRMIPQIRGWLFSLVKR